MDLAPFRPGPVLFSTNPTQSRRRQSAVIILQLAVPAFYRFIYPGRSDSATPASVQLQYISPALSCPYGLSPTHPLTFGPGVHVTECV